MKQAITKLLAGALAIGVLGAFALLVRGGPTFATALRSGAGPEETVARSDSGPADTAANVAGDGKSFSFVRRVAQGKNGEEDCFGAFDVEVNGEGGPGDVLFYSATEAEPFEVMIDAPAQAGGAIAAASAQSLELVDSSGVLVAGVVKDSAAAKAGLRRGDIILSVDGKELGDTPVLEGLETVAAKKAGESVQLKVKRGDADVTLALTLPESKVEGQAHGFIGILPAMGGHGPVKMMMRHLGGPIGTVMDVVADTPAAKAGIKAGERIVSVEGQKPAPGKDVAALIGAHKPGETVTLEVAAKDAKDEAARKVTVTLAENPDKKGTAFLGVKVGAVMDIKMHHGGLGQHLKRFFHRGFGPGQDAVPPVGPSPDKAAPGAGVAPSVRPAQPATGGSSM